MFDFEKLDVYQKIRVLNKDLLPWIFKIKAEHKDLADQLQRASLSIAFNLAEGTGRHSNADKKRFYIMSRSSLFECVAILHVMLDNQIIAPEIFKIVYDQNEQVSKMMLGMIRNVPDDDRLSAFKEPDSPHYGV